MGPDPSVLLGWEHTYSVFQWPILRQLLKALTFAIVGFALIFVGVMAVRGELTLDAMLFPVAVGGAFLAFVVVASPIVILVTGTTVHSRFLVRAHDVVSAQIRPVVLPMDGDPVRSIAWADVRKVVLHEHSLLVELHGPIDVAVMLHCPDRGTYDQVVALCRSRGL